jgi:hypothetical protein
LPQPYAAPVCSISRDELRGHFACRRCWPCRTGRGLAGCWLNTGEGGLSPYHLEGDCDLVFQIGTAKYGVRDDRPGSTTSRLRAELAAHPQVRMFEIKLSQGAKPGKGGILPGAKVTPEIAAIRGIPAGLDSISPNRPSGHRRCGADLLDMIARIRDVTGKPVGFKFVIGAYGWLDELFARRSAPRSGQRARLHHRGQRRRRHRRGADERSWTTWGCPCARACRWWSTC